VVAAIGVLDTDGLDGLTMRRLAQSLDTAAGSLYVYFAHRDELLASVYDEILGEVPLPDADGIGGWRAQLTDLLLETIRVLGRHGGISRVALGSIPTGPSSLALANAILGLLYRGGVDDQAAAWAIDQLTLYVDAAALEESTYQARGGVEASVVESLRATYAALPAERYPHVHRLRDRLTVGSGDDRARWFINTVLDGMTPRA
jgi:AcrR family transcriptional regulator